MAHSVYAIATDTDLDLLVGGQAHGAETLRPVGWDNLEPALVFAYDETQYAIETCLADDPDAIATVERAFSVAAKATKRAILFMAAARLYELAATEATEGSIYLRNHKAYLSKFQTEMTRVCEALKKATIGPPGSHGGLFVIELERG